MFFKVFFQFIVYSTVVLINISQNKTSGPAPLCPDTLGLKPNKVPQIILSAACSTNCEGKGCLVLLKDPVYEYICRN